MFNVNCNCKLVSYLFHTNHFPRHYSTHVTVHCLKALIYLQAFGDVDMPLKYLTKEKLGKTECYVTLTINSHTHIFKRIFNTRYQTRLQQL